MKTYKYHISGMTCVSCAMAIERAVASLPNVPRAYVDFSAQTIEIDGEEGIAFTSFEHVVSKVGSYRLKKSRRQTHAPSQKHTQSMLRWGLMGALGISAAFYLVQVLGMQDWLAPFSFVQEYWHLVLPLIFVFAVQTALFRGIRLKTRHGGAAALAASGSVSTGSMLACCMHNLAPLIPLMGISGLAVVTAAYQTEIFLASILIAYAGALVMWRKYRAVHAACHAPAD